MEKRKQAGGRECLEEGSFYPISQQRLHPNGTYEGVPTEGEGTNVTGEEYSRWRGQQVHYRSMCLVHLRMTREPQWLEHSEERGSAQMCDQREQQTMTTGRSFGVKWEGTPSPNFLGNL